MGKRKKNSNYITDKTKQKKLDKEKQKKSQAARKNALTVGAIVLIVALLALATWGILKLIGSIYDPHAGHDHGTESSSEESSSKAEESSSKEPESMPKDNDGLAVTHTATMKIKGYDKAITINLFGEEAPITVANFVKLANEGFYDGLTFHRIVGNIVQGGDPEGNGRGGSGTEITGEFSANGVTNNVKHVRGVISMARATPYDSASCQFFVLTGASSAYNGQYAGFGMVTDGMEIFDELASKFESNNIPASEQPIIESITVKKVS